MRSTAILSALLAFPLATLVLAPRAEAQAPSGSLTIEFDLTASTLAALGGLLQVPPGGSFTSASAVVTLGATGLATPLPGPVTLSGLTLDATVDASLIGNDVFGSVSAAQIGTALGSLTASLMQALLLPPLVLDVDASVDCAGFLCGVVGIAFPLTLNGSQTLNESVAFAVSGLEVAGSAMVSGALVFDFDGTNVMLSLVGSEVFRSFEPLPEPALPLALGAGAAGLLGLRRARRRRR